VLHFKIDCTNEKTLVVGARQIERRLPLQKSARAFKMQQETENIQPNRRSIKSARKWRVPAAAEDSLRALQHAFSKSPRQNLQQVTALLSDEKSSAHPSNGIDRDQDQDDVYFSRPALVSHNSPYEHENSIHEYILELTEMIEASVKRFYVDLNPAQERMLL
jgi:hypothetical protein